MKHLSRKYKKRTLRKNRVFGKKNRKTVVKKRNYKKRNTRKRRRVGGMYEEDEDDVEVGRINKFVQPKHIVPFIDIKDPSIMESGILKPVTPISKSTTPILRGPTPSIEPNMSSWQGFKRVSKENLKKYMEKGDFGEPPLTKSQEDRALLKAFVPEVFEPEVFEKSDDEFQTPRSSISSDVGSYGTPRSEEEKVQVSNTYKSNRKSDPILDIYNFKSPEEREMIARALERKYDSSDDEEDYYSKKNIEKRKKEKKQNLKALREEYGIDTDSD
jgi:hypothetical protein